MKILVHSKNGDAAGLCHRFKAEGHDVYVFLEKNAKKRHDMDNMIEKVGSVSEGVAKGPDFILFDREGNGDLADKLRDAGEKVCCASAFADKMELDRQFGIDLMDEYGIMVPKTDHFDSVDAAVKFVEQNQKAYAIKMDGNKGTASSYVSKDAKDMLEYLRYQDEMGLIDSGTKFVLQEVVKGAEISTEVWFCDGKPIPPYNGTFETKKFFPGDLGENTGCETSAVFQYQNGSKMVGKTIAKMFKFLEKEKWNGCLDINCIVSEKDHEPYALEWTVRLGYSAIYALCAMMKGGVSEFFHDLACGTLKRVPVNMLWGTSIRLNIPPYPFDDERDEIKRSIYEKTAGQIIKAPDIQDWWPLDVKKDEKGRNVTAGIDGTIGECTGSSMTLTGAWKKSQAIFDAVQVSNKRGRYIDGIQSAQERIRKMRAWGYTDVPSV